LTLPTRLPAAERCPRIAVGRDAESLQLVPYLDELVPGGRRRAARYRASSSAVK
jgi:hypothetical protein